MQIFSCTLKEAPEIRDIFNEVIAHSTSLYDYKPRSLEVVESWMQQRMTMGLPIIGIRNGEFSPLAGFASYGPFRHFPAYKYTVEHSVYVHPDRRGEGIATVLMNEIIAHADAAGVHTMIGVIDANNEASKNLHVKLGFEHCGHIKEAGYKFGRWLNLDFYQRILSGPSHPVED